MLRHQTIVANTLALCLTLSAGFNPAFGSGLIPTERLVAPVSSTSEAAESQGSIQDRRARLQSALVAAGVDASHAQTRLADLTDAEVADLSQRIDSAPAGGVWFLPFLLVAAVIGVLIGTRSPQGRSDAPSTDLFGRPRNLATAP